MFAPNIATESENYVKLGHIIYRFNHHISKRIPFRFSLHTPAIFILSWIICWNTCLGFVDALCSKWLLACLSEHCCRLTKCKHLLHGMRLYPWQLTGGGIWRLSSGPVFCLLLRVSSDYAQPITGQVTEVTCPVIGWAQPELTQSKRQKTGPGQPDCTKPFTKNNVDSSWVSVIRTEEKRHRMCPRHRNTLAKLVQHLSGDTFVWCSQVK